MPRLGPKASSLLLATLVVLAAALAVLSPAGAQENNTTADGNETAAGNETVDGGNATDGAGNETGGDGAAGGSGDGTGTAGGDGGVPPRYFTVRSQEDGCPGGANPCWDLEALPVHPGDNVELHVDMTSGFHDLTFADPLSDVATPSPANGVHVLTFTVPEDMSAPIEYVCTIHPATMVGFLVPFDQLGAETGEVDVVNMGVHFLAYWVGVIAFALLFVVYGATFFLFKHNETAQTTDHWDRSGGPAQKLETRNAVLLALLVAAVVIGGIVWYIQQQQAH